jgi:hypothetical protein
MITPYEDVPSLRMLLGAVTSDPFMDILLAAGLTWAAHSSVAIVLLIMAFAAQAVVPPHAWSIRYSEGQTMPVSFSDLQLAYEFVSTGGMGENQAYLDRQSGKIYWHSEFGDDNEKLPHDIDDEKYISIPDKRELYLGKPLVLDFTREFLPSDYDQVCHIFSQRGAYRRYKTLLVRRGVLERWYEFSNKAEEAALREWCAEHGIHLSGT